MTNITGLCDLDDTPANKRKKGRQLTKLDSDETEDDSEEFQLSE